MLPPLLQLGITVTGSLRLTAASIRTFQTALVYTRICMCIFTQIEIGTI